MTTKIEPMKVFWAAFATAMFLAAAWLLSPFIKIDATDFARAAKLAPRLAFGLIILLLYSGKWAFDVFSPQGFARKVSGPKSIALIVFNLLIVAFMIFIIAQAASLFLQTSASQTTETQY